MLTEYLKNAAHLYPTHPIVQQPLTPDFQLWLTQMTEHLATDTQTVHIPTIPILDQLWQWWQLDIKGMHQLPLFSTLTSGIPHE